MCSRELVGLLPEIHWRHVFSPLEFQVPRGQLRIGAFGRQDMQCLSLIISTILHNTSDGQRLSCSLLYYVDSLL